MTEFTSALADDDKAVAGAFLSRALADLVDLSVVAKESAIAEHPTGWIQDTDVVEYFVAALKVVIARLRKGIEETAEADIVSQDMLIGITAALEKHLWMFQVER